MTIRRSRRTFWRRQQFNASQAAAVANSRARAGHCKESGGRNAAGPAAAGLQSAVQNQVGNLNWNGYTLYSKGFVNGFWGGITTTVDAAKLALSAAEDLYGLAVFPQRDFADRIVSWYYGIDPAVNVERYNYIQQKIASARRFAQNVQKAYGYVSRFTGSPEVGDLLNNLISGQGLSPKDQQLVRQGVDVATDLAALVVNALADVKPEQAGQIAGFVTEQVLEQVLIILFTEGGGEGAAAAAFSGANRGDSQRPRGSGRRQLSAWSRWPTR